MFDINHSALQAVKSVLMSLQTLVQKFYGLTGLRGTSRPQERLAVPQKDILKRRLDGSYEGTLILMIVVDIFKILVELSISGFEYLEGSFCVSGFVY